MISFWWTPRPVRWVSGKLWQGRRGGNREQRCRAYTGPQRHRETNPPSSYVSSSTRTGPDRPGSPRPNLLARSGTEDEIRRWVDQPARVPREISPELGRPKVLPPVPNMVVRTAVSGSARSPNQRNYTEPKFFSNPVW